MNTSEQRYVTYNLNWLLVVENGAFNTAFLDHTVSDMDVVARALTELKIFLLGPDAPMLVSSPTMLFPLRDYVLAKFGDQHQAVVDAQVNSIFHSGHSISEAFKKNVLVIGEHDLRDLDIITPSLLSQEARKDLNIEFYILPIKMTFLEEDADSGMLQIEEVLGNEETLRQTINFFEGSNLMQSLLPKANKLAIAPILSENNLRTMVQNIKKISGKISNGQKV